MRRDQTKSARRFAAGICLLAAVLLYAPAAAAAIYAQASCCASGYCPMAGHHHEGPPASAPAQGAAECEHSNVPAAGECALRCCDTTEKTFVHAVLFELPPTALMAAPTEADPAWTRVPARSEDIPSRPPLPPPKSAASF
ncbi:MAG TPA: hypothetical protein VEH49_03840 [Methylomirabilota bacterium]|nr:hypothetical protein [Methylomirabilota bacterium]